MTTPDYIEDTIVAAATPPGIGGISIVRVSGPDAETIVQKVSGSLPEPRQAVLRDFRSSDGVLLDKGVVLYFPAPASFTGESVVEFHGHGGPVVTSSIVDAIIAIGARQALPGEFSKRAFLNDKLDLVQAEAIADLIESGTQQAARAALRSLSGLFSEAIEGVQAKLIAVRMHVEAALDFPEEEIDFLSDDALLARLDDCADALAKLGSEAAAGRVLRDGFQVVIIGRPNAGKSSLLNLLSGEDTAIVTELAGTTRDILRERINIDGLLVELVDTAGLRNDPDRIEAEGIRRAREAISKADAILWIQDASDAHEESIHELEPSVSEHIPVIRVRNKIDLTGEAPGEHAVPSTDKTNVKSTVKSTIHLSAKTGEGRAELRTQIRRLAGYRDMGEGAFTARRRHLRAIATTREHFDRGRQALNESGAGEILAEELRLSQQALGEITGSFTGDDLLGKIFSEFCIGK